MSEYYVGSGAWHAAASDGKWLVAAELAALDQSAPTAAALICAVIAVAEALNKEDVR